MINFFFLYIIHLPEAIGKAGSLSISSPLTLGMVPSPQLINLYFSLFWLQTCVHVLLGFDTCSKWTPSVWQHRELQDQ